MVMKVGRNDPCPCGSGKKFKHCCGSDSPARLRQCGTCTACCDGWLRIEIHGHPVYPGTPCPYSTGHSCRIYDDRPQDPCREFNCGWFEPASPLPDWFRPDKVGIIILRGKLDWQGLPVDVVVPAGQDPTPEVLAWLEDHGQTHGRPFIYQTQGLWHAFGPPAFQQEILGRLSRNEKLW